MGGSKGNEKTMGEQKGTKKQWEDQRERKNNGRTKRNEKINGRIKKERKKQWNNGDKKDQEGTERTMGGSKRNERNNVE